MTPYATLLVRASDGDEAIRARFHALSRHEHPDRPGAQGVPGEQWYPLAGAYSMLKTEALRTTWERTQRGLSGLCATCKGFGVVGTRKFGGKIRICEACEGKGRRLKR